VQRDESHRLLLLCCPIVYFSTPVPASGQLTYHMTRQMQLAAVPKLLPPPKIVAHAFCCCLAFTTRLDHTQASPRAGIMLGALSNDVVGSSAGKRGGWR